MEPINNSKNFWRHYFHPAALPFWIAHFAAGLIFFFPFQWQWLGLAVAGYFVRMFFVTGVYHRYFAHQAFKTSRAFQFILAVGAQMSCQKGILWWASHHRHHHRFSDQPQDLHSPQQGFWWSHMGWILSNQHNAAQLNLIQDFAKFPELRFLERFWILPFIFYSFIVTGIGALMGSALLGFLWGGLVSTVLLWHGTFTINSLSHIWGERRYETTDTSRNNFWLALITLGEGWHNNHHFYPRSARNGFRWYELDVTFWVLRTLSFCGLVWDLKPAPKELQLPVKNDFSSASNRFSSSV